MNGFKIPSTGDLLTVTEYKPQSSDRVVGEAVNGSSSGQGSVFGSN